MSCPDDTDEKRLARYFLYRRAKALWDVGGRADGKSVVLAGTEASEVGCLKYVFQEKSSNVLFVDNAATTGLQIAQVSWPGVETSNQALEKVLEQQTTLAFLNLDFCGYLNHKAIYCLEQARDLISLKGFVGYTFSRDRESDITPSWNKVQQEAAKLMKNDPKYKGLTKSDKNYLDVVRFVGYSSVIRSLLGKQYQQVYSIKYRGRKPDGRNMGVLMFQNMPPEFRTPEWREEVAKSRSREELEGKIDSATARKSLSKVVINLLETKSGKEVASILHIPNKSIAAWKANVTRGTYNTSSDDVEA